jgi:hypothetical protein
MVTSASRAAVRGTNHPLPQRIGRYEVRARLGEGATSEVFLARDDFHDRMVAIKRVRRATLDDPVDAHYSSRFFAAEAALVGRLKHPNVVQVYDAVDDPQGPYLVLEHVPGGTLREHCRPDALLSLEQIVEVGVQVRDGARLCVPPGADPPRRQAGQPAGHRRTRPRARCEDQRLRQRAAP